MKHAKTRGRAAEVANLFATAVTTPFAVPIERESRRRVALDQIDSLATVEDLERLVAMLAYGVPLDQFSDEMLRVWASGKVVGNLDRLAGRS